MPTGGRVAADRLQKTLTGIGNAMEFIEQGVEMIVQNIGRGRRDGNLISTALLVQGLCLKPGTAGTRHVSQGIGDGTAAAIEG